MTIEIRQFNFAQPTNGVALSRLDAIEVELGGQLDEDFRDFLSKTNGGRPDPGLVSHFRLLPYPVILFLGLDESKSNLLDVRRELRQSIGRTDLVPIAYDTSLGRICLKIGFRHSPVVLVSVDELYHSAPTTFTNICDSFVQFWGSLSQPRKLIPKLEALAERPWCEIKTQIATNPEYYLKSRSNELTLLCQVIRAENEDAFLGLVAEGANLDGALKIAVSCGRFDFVEKLVQSGADAAEGLPYAVGPDRKKIREYLEKEKQ